jgi:hypothetical protein
MTLIYLAEISAYDPALPGVVTLRYSSGTGYAHPSAAGFYDPRILQPATLQRTAFDSGTTTGAVATGYGALVLANNDGALDALADYGFDGRTIRILLGESTGSYAGFAELFVGTMEQPRLTIDAVEILLRDRLFELDAPVQATRYGGTNALPAGVDGGDDLKGRPIPRVYGVVRGVSPPLVNTARLIYQVAAGTVASVAVFDSGVPLTAGATYADLAAMQATAPAAGQYRLLSSAGGSYVRLGATPGGALTCDVTQGVNAAARTAAQILQALATGPGGIASGDVVAGDVTALDAAASAPLGLWLDGEQTVRQAMTQVAQSVGAWFGFDRLGKLRMRQLVVPSGSPAGTFRRLDRFAVADAATADIVELERITTQDSGAGVPAWRVRLEYRRRYTVQSPDSLAGSVLDADRALLGQEWQAVTADDAAVKTKHLLAPELAFQGLFDAAADAQAEATRRLTLYKTRRDRFRLRVAIDTGFAPVLDLGDVVRLELPRFGLAGGKLFTIIGITPDAARRLLDLDLWG